MTQQEGRSRFAGFWRYLRMVLIVVLGVLLIMQIVRGQWGDVPITAVFVALLTFLEAMDRGWISGLRGGGPPGSR